MSELVSCSPESELTFKGPFNEDITVKLILTNITGKTIAYKLKTTAPKKYCVRPNSGTISAKGQEEISIIMQPLKEIIPENFVCKDKFLVQTAELLDEEIEQKATDVWPTIEKTRKEYVKDYKLRVTYVAPFDTAVSHPINSNNNGASSSPSVAAVTPLTPSANATKSSGGPAIADQEALKKANEKIVLLQHELKNYQDRVSTLVQQQASQQSKSPAAVPLVSKSNQISPLVIVIIAIIAYLVGKFI